MSKWLTMGDDKKKTLNVIVFENELRGNANSFKHTDLL